MIRAIKGTRDIFPPESEIWNQVENIAREIFLLYGFSEIRTPIFENTELFTRGVGKDTDIVSKEMYSFLDRNNRSITLRPEGTASVVRSYLEHQLYNDPQTLKLYYLGPMFRRERPQKGRSRQFHQLGVEVLGSDHPAIEAEVIEMLQLFLNRVGIANTELLLNSIGCSHCRPNYLKILKTELTNTQANLCVDCQRRALTNPLRVLDCKIESCQLIIKSLPSILDFLDQPCQKHFEQFLQYLKDRHIKYKVAPQLVRGLDYYTRTTFEITSTALGAQNTLVGGGRYDGLAELLGGQSTQGFGFALGIERIILLLQEKFSSLTPKLPTIFLAPLGEKGFKKATLVAQNLRNQGLRCLLDFTPRSLKSAMRLANKLKTQYLLIVGSEELESGKYPLKRMHDGIQILVEEKEIFYKIENGLEN